MTIYPVGPKPIVSPRGVSFDSTHPDHYPFISPALELLEAIDFDTEKEEEHLQQPRENPYSGSELLQKVEEQCGDLKKLLDATEEKTRHAIAELEERVRSNPRISEEERRAWLGNIEAMKKYYLQYIANETVYRCLLEKMADHFLSSHLATITFPLRNSYGLVLGDLVTILRDHKPAYDAQIRVEERNGELMGRFEKLTAKS
ncbi:hypothetical protein [Nitratifractor sp.]